jgi:hypothetical protein
MATVRPYQLPHAPTELEGAIIGGIILENRALASIPDLEVQDFYDPRHRIVFAAIRNLEAKLRPIDVITLENEIEKDGKLDAIGGVAFLGELSLHVPIVANVIVYAEEVKLAARNARVIVELDSLLERAKRGLIEPSEMLGEAIRDLQRIAPEPATAAQSYGHPFVEFVGTDEPEDNPADVFDVHGFIVRGEPSLLIGDPKVGKTLLLEDLILQMAAGRREWCGLRIYRRPRVLLFLREDSERTTRRRLWQVRVPEILT